MKRAPFLARRGDAVAFTPWPRGRKSWQHCASASWASRPMRRSASPTKRLLSRTGHQDRNGQVHVERSDDAAASKYRTRYRHGRAGSEPLQRVIRGIDLRAVADAARIRRLRLVETADPLGPGQERKVQNDQGLARHDDRRRRQGKLQCAQVTRLLAMAACSTPISSARCSPIRNTSSRSRTERSRRTYIEPFATLAVDSGAAVPSWATTRSIPIRKYRASFVRPR